MSPSAASATAPPSSRPDDPENFRKAITPRTRRFYAETISNPRGNMLDIEAVAKIAHQANVPLNMANGSSKAKALRPAAGSG